jgi:pantoate--beta-alanine ligase
MRWMKLVRTIADLRKEVRDTRKQGKSIGFVPTMGALHEGHLSLVRTAKAQTDFVVVSIFVNPTQFGPNEDFHRYPRPLEADVNLCTQANADLLFNPSVEEMYPAGFSTTVEVTGVSDGLCGAHRPGHFRGVTTVVMKLFHQVMPDKAFFGQKDAQQCAVLRKMVLDMDLDLQMEICPTVREKDGLAMSSRNRYLSNTERSVAPGIYAALMAFREEAVKHPGQGVTPFKNLLLGKLKEIPGVTMDYVEVVDSLTMKPMEILRGSLVVAVALRLGSTRLIDNILVNIPS